MGKRGTKPKTGLREPNGRLSRKQSEVTRRAIDGLDREEVDTLSVGLEARERLFGLPKERVDEKSKRKVYVSRDQKAGSAIGRYCLQGLVTQAQYDAAMLFLESYHRNLRAIDAPPQPGAVDLNRTHGLAVGLENVKQLTKWRAEHKATLAAIQDKQNEIRLMGNRLTSFVQSMPVLRVASGPVSLSRPRHMAGANHLGALAPSSKRRH